MSYYRKTAGAFVNTHSRLKELPFWVNDDPGLIASTVTLAFGVALSLHRLSSYSESITNEELHQINDSSLQQNPDRSTLEHDGSARISQETVEMYRALLCSYLDGHDVDKLLHASRYEELIQKDFKINLNQHFARLLIACRKLKSLADPERERQVGGSLLNLIALERILSRDVIVVLSGYLRNGEAGSELDYHAFTSALLATKGITLGLEESQDNWLGKRTGEADETVLAVDIINDMISHLYTAVEALLEIFLRLARIDNVLRERTIQVVSDQLVSVTSQPDIQPSDLPLLTDLLATLIEPEEKSHSSSTYEDGLLTPTSDRFSSVDQDYPLLPPTRINSDDGRASSGLHGTVPPIKRGSDGMRTMHSLNSDLLEWIKELASRILNIHLMQECVPSGSCLLHHKAITEVLLFILAALACILGASLPWIGQLIGIILISYALCYFISSIIANEK